MYDENYQMERSATSSALAACLANVYWWMTFALLVSGVTAWAVGTSEELSRMVFQNRAIFIILILAELGIVFGLERSDAFIHFHRLFVRLDCRNVCDYGGHVRHDGAHRDRDEKGPDQSGQSSFYGADRTDHCFAGEYFLGE